MDDKLIAVITEDIERCKNHTKNEGSFALYQTLIGKYNSIFPNFSSDIPKSGKATCGGEFNYRPELNAIKEKLELLLITEQNKDPLFPFKEMYDSDLKQLKEAIQGTSFSEEEKSQLYLSLTAKYHPYVPQFGDGLYQYYPERGFYEEVSGDTLSSNLNKIYNKLLTYQSLEFPGLISKVENTPNNVININNKNENSNTITVSFDTARETVNNMTSLPDEDIHEVLKKIDEIEKIVKSTDSKNKKWSKLTNIIKWIADKSVDVGINLVPLLLQIK